MIPKDFQKATANRILTVFQNGQNRILLADEVGLGKTIIASDVIKQVSKWHKIDKNDDHFKVIYICSNINIANQNARKLGITDLMNVSESRLSMQHLKIYQNNGTDHSYEQLIPLTPATSFSMTSGCGNQEERALMYAHLRRLDCFCNIQAGLSKLMAYDAVKHWDGHVDHYEQEAIKCDANGSNYLVEMQIAIKKKLNETNALAEDIVKLCQTEICRAESRQLINALRKMFAQISLEHLDPDLVIMDEFQRFRDLITPTDDEQGMLSKQFLQNTATKVLLLSATPYKPYSTLEEISLDSNGEHHKEFMDVMDFLFYNEQANADFKRVWSNYSGSLCEISSSDLTVLITRKDDAEAQMYKSVCRTERFNTGIIDDSAAKEIEISEGDILSYCEMQDLLDSINNDSKKPIRYKNVPLEYVKSSPYLLSFMESYKLKTEIKNYFKESKKYELVKNAKHKTLLLRKNLIHNYLPIPSNNARLAALKSILFKDGRNATECLLWVPASRPYYKVKGVFEKNKHFSKILCFSSWEIVPRMIASLISYEAERLTIGKLYREESSKRGRGYFATKEERRYGITRLKNESEEILCYPSVTLANLYNPAEYVGKDINQIKEDLKEKLSPYIEKIKSKHKIAEGRISSAKAILEILKALDNKYAEPTSIPNGTIDVLINIAIAAPAVCAFRIFKNEEYAAKLAKGFVSIFNKPESSAILDLLYKKNEDAYYENVFEYCVSGNLQAVLDEYAHIIGEQGETLKNAMLDGFSDTTPLQIDMIESFTGGESKKSHMRSHFAVGYFNARVSEENVQRTETIRMAFNSPFRPFVLATTSIGQEGLDFHQYCRKVMHWNLPSNPIDIEQREGRVNRYKCLAVRQNVAHKYGNESDWDAMFKKATEEEKGNFSDLIPFWSLPENEHYPVKIERIVPMYPLSQDKLRYARLIKILSLYRLTLGQPRQEELIELLSQESLNLENDNLFLNLSPFDRK